MRRIKVLGLGFVLLLASFLPTVASAREYETTGATVVVQYYDGGYYGYRDRDDYYRHYRYYRRHRDHDEWRYRRYHRRRWHHWRHYDRDDYWR